MIGLEGQTLQSERLTYRLLEESDKAPLKALLSDRAVTEPAGFLPAESQAEFDAFWGELTQYNTGIALLHGRELIGYFHVNKYPAQQEPYAGKPCVDIGFVVGKPYQGQGFATEAVAFLTALLKGRFAYCFAARFTDNIPSRRVLEKSGYSLLETESVFIPALGEEKECLQYVF